MRRLSQFGHDGRTPALWQRVLAVFCMALIGVASTVQVCHSHTDAFEAGLLKNALGSLSAGASGADAAVASFGGKAAPAKEKDGRDPGSDSAVRCPLCVAMHSAMPVIDSLTPIALVRLETLAPVADGIEREFRWRFEMASRPPPVMASRA